MRLIYTLLLLGGLFASASAQTILCAEESVELSLPDSYTGEVQWQVREPGKEWKSIQGATQNGFLYKPPTEEVSIRAKVTEAGCDPIYSSIQELKVAPEALDIQLDIPALVCSSEPVVLAVENTFGGALQWQVREGDQWMDIPGANTNNFPLLFGNVTEATFRAQISIRSCGSYVSNPLSVERTDDLSGLSIEGPTNYCAGSTFQVSLNKQISRGVLWQVREGDTWKSLPESDSSVIAISGEQAAYEIRAIIGGGTCPIMEVPSFSVVSGGTAPSITYDTSKPYLMLDSLHIDLEGSEKTTVYYRSDTLVTTADRVSVMLRDTSNSIKLVLTTADGCEAISVLRQEALPLYRLSETSLATEPERIVSDSAQIMAGTLILDWPIPGEVLQDKIIYVDAPLYRFLGINSSRIENGQTHLSVQESTIWDIMTDQDSIVLDGFSAIAPNENESGLSPSFTDLDVSFSLGGMTVKVVMEELDIEGPVVLTKSSQKGIKSIRGKGYVEYAGDVVGLNKERVRKASLAGVGFFDDIKLRLLGKLISTKDAPEIDKVIPTPITIGAFQLNLALEVDLSDLKVSLGSSIKTPFDFFVEFDSRETVIVLNSGRYIPKVEYSVKQTEGQIGEPILPEANFDVSMDISANVGAWVTITGANVGPKITAGPVLKPRLSGKVAEGHFTTGLEIGLSGQSDVVAWEVPFTDKEGDEKRLQILPYKIGSWDWGRLASPSRLELPRYTSLTNGKAEVDFQVFEEQLDLLEGVVELPYPGEPSLILRVPPGSSDRLNGKDSIMVQRTEDGKAVFNWDQGEGSEYRIEAELFVPDGFEVAGSPTTLYACPETLTIDQSQGNEIDSGESYTLSILENLESLLDTQGELRWEYSENGNSWEPIPLAIGNGVEYFPEATVFVRAVFSSTECYSLEQQLVSEAFEITVVVEYQLQIGDYHNDYSKINVIATYKNGDHIEVPNYMTQNVRLLRNGEPVPGEHGLEWTPFVFGKYPESPEDIVEPEYKIKIWDAENSRFGVVTVHANLSNAGYRSFVGKRLTARESESSPFYYPEKPPIWVLDFFPNDRSQRIYENGEKKINSGYRFVPYNGPGKCGKGHLAIGTIRTSTGAPYYIHAYGDGTYSANGVYCDRYDIN